ILVVNRGVNIGGQFDLFLSDSKKSDEYFKFIAGIKSLDRYTYKWNKDSDCYFKFDQDLEEELRSQGSTMVLGNPERYLKEKLFIPESAQFLMASYVKERVYSAYGIMVGTEANPDYNIKYACALINSRLFTFYAIEKEILRKGSKATPHVGVKGLKSIPVHLISHNHHAMFVTLVDYVLLVKGIDTGSPINEYVPNNHIGQLFEEVIDGLVYELYFEEDFKKVGIAFMKYAERDFKSIEGKSEKEAIKIIHAAYQKLREKDNEIRQNLKLMDTRLADLIMPIKTVK
ncbi:MAG: TaqI-like C-terminal specificity domain-containing protein, partial [Flammeovirgaceae bacterium]